MSQGYSDGVSKVWILRRKGALDIEGFRFRSDLGAIQHLVRCILVDGKTAKDDIRTAVEWALTHLDDLPKQEHDDE